MIGVLRNGVLGMSKASEMVDTAAGNIGKTGIRSNTSGTSSRPVVEGDVARDSVNMIIGHRTYDANAKVAEAAAKMLDVIV